MLVAEGRLPPSQAEVRFSARRTAQVANYNEDEEDEFEEEIDENTPNYWATALEETGPIIDKVLDHRPKEGDRYCKSSFSSFAADQLQNSILIMPKRRILSIW